MVSAKFSKLFLKRNNSSPWYCENAPPASDPTNWNGILIHVHPHAPAAISNKFPGYLLPHVVVVFFFSAISEFRLGAAQVQDHVQPGRGGKWICRKVLLSHSEASQYLSAQPPLELRKCRKAIRKLCENLNFVNNPHSLVQFSEGI